MKLTKEDHLRFLEWLVDNHEDAIRLHSRENTTSSWWKQHREHPYQQPTSAILSTSWVFEQLVQWSQLPGVANVALTREERCAAQKALTVFIRRAWAWLSCISCG